MQTQKTDAARAQRVWRFDPAYTTVEFSVRNLWYTVHGRFRELEGSIAWDETDMTRSSVVATIKARSIDTGNKQRDASLQSRDFLDGDKFPDIEFRSTRVARGKDRDSLDVEGELIVKGKSTKLALVVNEMDRSRKPSGEEFVYYSAITEIDRFAFGIGGSRGIIGRKVKVTINVQATA